MLNNYFSPQAPDTGFKPGGFLGGMLYADQYARYKDMASLQDMMAKMSAQTQGEELYMGAPMRQAERDSKTAKFGVDAMVSNEAMQTPGYASTMVGGTMGDAQTRQAKGRKDMATVGSEIDATNISNVVKGLEQTGRMLEMAMSTNPLMGQMEYKAFLEKVPPALRQQFPPQYTPQVPQILSQLANTIKNSPEHRRATEIHSMDNASRERIASGNNAATRYAADQRAAQSGSRIKTLMQQAEAAKTPEAAVYLGRMLLADPDLHETDRVKVEAMVKAATAIIAEKVAKGSFNLGDPRATPGDLADDIKKRLGGPSAAPQAQVHGTTPEGYQIIGQNPDGSFKIRDPKTGRTGTYKK